MKGGTGGVKLTLLLSGKNNFKIPSLIRVIKRFKKFYTEGLKITRIVLHLRSKNLLHVSDYFDEKLTTTKHKDLR